MSRVLALLSSTLLLAAMARAQCPQANDAGLVPWDANLGYAATFAADDEGISPPIPLPSPIFWSDPVQAPVNLLDTVWIGSNGEIYLTDSTAGLTEPAGGALYGVTNLAEFEGAPGSSVRIVCLGMDTQASIAPGANWSVTWSSTPLSFTVTWHDMRRYGNTTGDRFSFQLRIEFLSAFDTRLDFDYSATVPGATQWVGVSSANGVSSPAPVALSSPWIQGGSMPSREEFTAATWDLAGLRRHVYVFWDPTFGSADTTSYGGPIPNPSGPCADNAPYGTGCHAYDVLSPTETFYQFFPDAAAANAGLQGNALVLIPNGLGYDAFLDPGAAFLYYFPPTAGATTLTPNDDGNEVVTLPVPFPSNQGPVSQINVSHNGVITLGPVANNDGDFNITGPEVAAATGEAFYSFSDFRDDNTTPVPSGTIKTDLLFGQLLTVTWENVDHWANPQVSTPSTFAFQFDLVTGSVIILWQMVDTNTTSQFGSSWLVGYTGPGAGIDPGSTMLPPMLSPFTTVNNSSVPAMTLSAAPRPRINPSTVVTYTAHGLPEAAPGSGFYLSTLFFSLAPLPGGFDLAGILTTVPGCNAWIGSLDLDLGAQLTPVPTASWTYTFANGTFAPGDAIAAQAVALFDPAFPLGNGESGGFVFSNGVLSTVNPD